MGRDIKEKFSDQEIGRGRKFGSAVSVQEIVSYISSNNRKNYGRV